MSKPAGQRIVCDACPILCRIKPGATGVCDRYANLAGVLSRTDPLLLAQRTAERGGDMVPFLAGKEWDGSLNRDHDTFVTGIGAGTTYPDYKPAPFIAGSRHHGIDMVTVVSECIFSYCGVKVKIDTDRFLGPEQTAVLRDGQQVGHVTTNEYGSQMLSLGGVRHLTGGSKKEGKVTCRTLLELCNKQPVELTIEGGATVIVEAGRPPVINGERELRMRVGCGSATIGMFAKQWRGLVDEVVVVDDHITGVLSEHKAGTYLGVKPTGIKIKGRRSTPGRYFRVAAPGTGWGGTDITDPLAILGPFDPKHARPGLTLMMVGTTGEDAAYFVLDDDLRPVGAEMPGPLAAIAERIRDNCEPALCSVLFMAGAGGSLRAGVTENPVLLTRSVRESLAYVTNGGAPVYLWPGGGITYMVDVARMPDNAFGHVPTPAIVGPIEFTMRLEDFRRLGGHMDSVVAVSEVARGERVRGEEWRPGNPWPFARRHYRWDDQG